MVTWFMFWRDCFLLSWGFLDKNNTSLQLFLNEYLFWLKIVDPLVCLCSVRLSMVVSQQCYKFRGFFFIICEASILMCFNT